MEHWWRRHENVMEGDMIRGGYTKDQIEDITGKIPLFLDNCVLKDEKGELFMSLKTPVLDETYEQAWRFEQRIQAECDMADLKLYATLVLPLICI